MNKHVELHEDIKTKYLQEVKEKKELYNKVLELKGKEFNYSQFLNQMVALYRQVKKPEK